LRAGRGRQTNEHHPERQIDGKYAFESVHFYRSPVSWSKNLKLLLDNDFEAFIVPKGCFGKFSLCRRRVILESRQKISPKPFSKRNFPMANNLYKAEIRYAGDELFIGTTPGNYSLTIDTKDERKSAPTPVELLLVSVAACTAVDVVSILEKKRQTVTDYKVEITGERRDEHPRSFTKMHIHHIVYGRDVLEKALADAIGLSDEKYCSVAATVRPTVEITTSYEILQAG
jgi:putative redox protein